MTERTVTPRIVIAGTASGVGKTTIAVGLIGALRARGLKVAVFKCGPDYLDPTYHYRAAGTRSHNLDGWMMGRDAVIDTFASVARNADIAVIEGVMGLFDGASPKAEAGSTAEIAKWLEAPVLVAVDAAGIARTLAAVVRGIRDFDPALNIRGIICNRVGSKGHLNLLREAVSIPPVLGGLPSTPAMSFPQRHLGLRTADERAIPDKLFNDWATQVTEWLDIDAILKVARECAPLPCASRHSSRMAATSPRCRIGVAYDEAFHFYYEDNLRRLEQLGAVIVHFSPVHDSALPEVDGLYLGGGYPEVYGNELSRNDSMRAAVRRFAAAGGPVYAECGGLMYLTRAIRTLDGQFFPMVGIIPAEAVMHNSLQALGYVEVETQQSSLLGMAGLRFRGHEFRYSQLLDVPEHVARIYTVRRRRGDHVYREGYHCGNVLASYVHAHWASNHSAAASFVDTCEQFRRQRSSPLDQGITLA